MFGDLMGKMQEAQKEMEGRKRKMDGIFVEGLAEGGLVKVTATANKKITNIYIADELFEDKEALEDLLIVATNRAIAEAEKVFEAEIGGLAQGLLPGFGL